MTTTSATEQLSARDLLTPGGFQALADTVQGNNPGMEPALAERISQEALKFIHAAAANPGAHLVPSRVVDEGWHAAILHTKMYRKLCYKLGNVVDHFPERRDPSRHNQAAMDRSQAAIEALGYTVDRELWYHPEDRTFTVAADCTHKDDCSDACTAGCSNTGPN